jgi:hypothetical protein
VAGPLVPDAQPEGSREIAAGRIPAHPARVCTELVGGMLSGRAMDRDTVIEALSVWMLGRQY